MTENDIKQIKQHINSITIFNEKNQPIKDNFSKEIKDFIIYVKITDQHINQDSIQNLYNDVIQDFYKNYQVKINLKKTNSLKSNSFTINIYQSSILLTALFYYYLRLKIKESTQNTKTKCQIYLTQKPDNNLKPVERKLK